MSETSSWVLKGIDPSIRERAVEEAGRLGVSVSDYLTDVVVRNALLDQLNGRTEAEPAHAFGDDAPIAPLGDGPESYAVRHRLRGLERRLNAAVHTLDDTMFDLTARMGEMEGVVGDTANLVAQAQQENVAAFAGVQIDFSVVADNIAALAAAHTDRAAGHDRRLDSVDMIARNADEACAELAEAQDALKHAVASDFAEFASDITGRLHATLAEVRHTATEAAAEADAAIAHLVAEFRHARDVLDARLDESAAETRARMHAAFADAAERLGALAERVVDNENQAARTGENLRAQILDAEDAAQTALEETAQSLRQADAALASDAIRRAHEQEAALNDTRIAFANEILVVREDQTAQQQRIALLDAAFASTAANLSETRDAIAQRVGDGETQVRALLARAEADWNSRHNATHARLENVERVASHIRQTAAAEIDRVEACTNAALEKLAADIAQGDQDVAAQLTQLRGQADVENALLREGVAGALARATLLDGAVQRVETLAGPLTQRIAEIETAFSDIDQTLPERVADLETAAAGIDARLTARVAHLEATADASRALTHRVETQDAQLADSAEQLQGMTRLLNRIAAQSGETASNTEERVHAMEMALADLRLDHISAVSAERESAHDMVLSLQGRVAEIENTQVNAIHTITTEIARFIEDNERRLVTLESPAAPNHDLAAAFEELRKRVEERIIGVETRSVRMLDQVADTVAMIEQRFLTSQREDDVAKSA